MNIKTTQENGRRNMMKVYSLLVLVLFAMPAYAQQGPPSTYTPQLISFPGAPTGPCEIYQVALNNSNGQYSTCKPSTRTWVTSGAGGTIGGSATAQQVAFGASANAIAGDSQWTWDNVNERMIMGPPKASFNAISQAFLDTANDGSYSFRSLNTSPFRISTINVLAQNDLSDGATGLSPLTSTLVLTNPGTAPSGGWYAGGLTTFVDGAGSFTSGVVGALGLSAQTLTNANVAEMRVVDIDINHNGNGNITLASGVFSGIGNHGSGTIAQSNNYLGFAGANDGGGSITNQYGFHQPTIVAGTNRFAFAADNQGSGVNNYAYFAGGGHSNFNGAVGQTTNIFTVNNNSTATAMGGMDIVQGVGTGSFVGVPVLRETVLEDGAPYAHLTWMKAAPANNGFLEFMGTDGAYFLDNNTGGAALTFNASGTMEQTGGGFLADVFTQSPYYKVTEGAAPTGTAGKTTIYGDSTQHELEAATAGTSNFGLINRTQPGAIHQTAKVALISTATLCAAAAGACNVAGQYHVHWNFIETGTACGTPGTGGVTFLLTWTDTNATTHSAVSLGMDDASAINAVSQTFHFQTTLAAAWASGDFNISTNGAVIQYATGYTACGVGTGTYQLDAAVTRIQ